MKRFIVLVIDSFGVGEMDDVKTTRPKDIGANTYKSVIEKNPNIKIKNLEKLGIANAANLEIGNIKKSKDAVYGTANLLHDGCDTFYGHQELMGTLPKTPKTEPFHKNIDLVEKQLLEHGYKVEKYGDNSKILIINDCATVGDNLEADLGQVYNITGALDLIPYDELLKIGRLVRNVVKVPRVITFGGENVTLQNLKDAYEIKNVEFAGVNAPKSGVYQKGYRVQHMGYGIDSTVQLPTILGKDIKTILIGKVADIVENPFGKSILEVDTSKVMKHLIEEIKNNSVGFFCANVQETDLAGHQQNSKKYAEKLEIVDYYLTEILELLSEDDILVIMADHGNDPEIGHSNHTREKVPILLYKKNLKNIYLGERKTLGDVGQTVAKYFGKILPENGEDFKLEIDLQALRKEAENYYSSGKFYCSEAVVKVLKDYFNAPYGDEIIKLASGFPVGMGNGCTCGAVNGGVMAIGMFFGRDKEKGAEVAKCMALTKELQLEFTKKRKVCCCKVLTKGMTLGTAEHISHCVEITGELAELTGRILARELGYKEKNSN